MIVHDALTLYSSCAYRCSRGTDKEMINPSTAPSCRLFSRSSEAHARPQPMVVYKEEVIFRQDDDDQVFYIATDGVIRYCLSWTFHCPSLCGRCLSLRASYCAASPPDTRMVHMLGAAMEDLL